MRVLIGCEFSGVVRDAFKVRGHDAWSCDLLPSESPGQHIEGDLLDVLSDRWDLLIAHPPCTYLAVSGARYFPQRKSEQLSALEFVRVILNANIERIALENPVGVISSQIRKPDQIIQPYMFGHDASKKTCLWLKNLPKLIPTSVVLPRLVKGLPRYGNQTDSGQNRLAPSPSRSKERSITYKGIAEAMANQWG